MAEIALFLAEELDRRRNWKEGIHGPGQERKCSPSVALFSVSAVGRRAQQEEATAAALKIGPKEVELARRCLEPKSAFTMAASEFLSS